MTTPKDDIKTDDSTLSSSSDNDSDKDSLSKRRSNDSSNSHLQKSEYADIISDISGKIKDANNILVALSSDPSVDELAAAIGLSLAIDGMGKHTTAIYSGVTPDALQFLNPEKAFDSSPDSLQDFIIAINKDKADHLRYKVDGDYVKIFITPYHSRVSQDDLEFSYGDFNVDLVIALNVSNGIDLDSALREHGRIMHDAVVVNITTGRPGKLGEIEWSNPNGSSVSEMAAEIIYSMGTLSKEEATAFLTGIVAATDRFANARTTSRTMEVASYLMTSGADQQLIAEHITSDLKNMGFDKTIKTSSNTEDDKPTQKVDEPEPERAKEDPSKLSVHHDEPLKDEEKPGPRNLTDDIESPKPDDETNKNDISENEPSEEASALDDLNSVKETLENNTSEEPSSTPHSHEKKNIAPSSPSISATAPTPSMPKISPSPTTSTPPSSLSQPSPILDKIMMNNPATMSAPQVASTPEINHVPDINYMPMPGDEILPPPPTPPVDFSSPMSTPPSMSNPFPPASPMQNQNNNPGGDSTPNSFQIPTP